MVTLKQLRVIRKRLLLKKQKFAIKKAIAIEKKNLEKEIKELKNPRSLRAKKSLLRFGKVAGKFLLHRAKILRRNLDRATEDRPVRRRRRK